MYFSSRSWLILLPVILTPLSADAGTIDDLCCLCEGCKSPVNGRGTLHVDGFGKTCNKLMLEMADTTNASTPGSSTCRKLIGQFQTRCCDPSHNPLPIAQAPTTAPQDKYSKGSHPKCTLCHSGKFPENPYTIAAILGISGNPKCEDLYYMGLQGQISEQLCNPMQDYMDIPCGCCDRTNDPNCGKGKGGGSTGGGSPTNGGGGSPGDPGGVAPKKTPPEDDDKDDSKLFDEPKRGIDRRSRILRGS